METVDSIWSQRPLRTRSKKKEYKKPKIESKFIFQKWSEIYKSIHTSAQSEMIVFNYKVLFDALPCNQRFAIRVRNKCFLCERAEETQRHIFVDCLVTKALFAQSKAFFLEQNLQLTDHIIRFSVCLTQQDLRVVSIFKYALWGLRNKCRIMKVDNKNLIFKSLFQFYYKKFG